MNLVAATWERQTCLLACAVQDLTQSHTVSYSRDGALESIPRVSIYIPSELSLLIK